MQLFISHYRALITTYTFFITPSLFLNTVFMLTCGPPDIICRFIQSIQILRFDRFQPLLILSTRCLFWPIRWQPTLSPDRWIRLVLHRSVLVRYCRIYCLLYIRNLLLVFIYFVSIFPHLYLPFKNQCKIVTVKLFRWLKLLKFANVI